MKINFKCLGILIIIGNLHFSFNLILLFLLSILLLGITYFKLIHCWQIIADVLNLTHQAFNIKCNSQSIILKLIYNTIKLSIIDIYIFFSNKSTEKANL